MVKQERISYEEYKKRPRKKKNDESLVVFVSAFFIMLLLFLAVAKHLSPDVDVSINNMNRFEDSAATEEPEAEIDDRLKNLQAADQSREEDIFDYALEEPVKIPSETKKSEPKLLETKQEIEKRKEEEKKLQEEKLKKEQEALTLPKKEEPTEAKKVYELGPNERAKVIVGRYSSEEQAQMAKSIISDSGINMTPFVRNINGVYTIQVGSFSTRENAKQLVDELLKNNYPARIIIE